MTVEELAAAIESAGVFIGFLGRARAGDGPRTYCCSLQPNRVARSTNANRWPDRTLVIRGFGRTALAAVEDAMTKLSVAVMDRIAREDAGR